MKRTIKSPGNYTRRKKIINLWPPIRPDFSLNPKWRYSTAKSDRTVYRDGNGKWVNKRNDAEIAASLHETQAEAEKAARAQLKNSGDGKLTIKGRGGKIRSKDTIAPVKDPCPPKDKEH